MMKGGEEGRAGLGTMKKSKMPLVRLGTQKICRYVGRYIYTCIQVKRPAAAAKMEKQSSIVETEEEETAALTLDIKAGVGTAL